MIQISSLQQWLQVSPRDSEEILTNWPPRKKYLCTGLRLWGPSNWSGSLNQQIDPVLAFFLLIRAMDAACHVFVRHITIPRLPGYTAYKILALGYLDVAASKSTTIGSEA